MTRPQIQSRGSTTGRGSTKGSSSVPGRGGSQSGSGRGRKPWNHSPKPLPSVITSDFSSLHQKCGAARYKVHKPGCECSKLKQARLALSSAATSPSTSNSKEHVLDGLVVIPDTRSTNLVYMCLDTGIDTFQRESQVAEKKLKAEMFPEKSVASFKASCGACLLEDVPNGFVCVSSPSRQTVDFARDLARKEASRKRKEGKLHADHAHYVCSLSKHTLCQLNHARTRHQKQERTDEVVAQFIPQGIPATSGEHVELGHHLKSLIELVWQPSDNASHWLVLVYDDRGRQNSPCWTIDLPGGKRHLGETSWQCAVRETEEEVSLQIDLTWQTEEHPRIGKHPSDNMNAYYFLTTPSDLLVESLETSFGKLMDSDLAKSGRMHPVPSEN